MAEAAATYNERLPLAATEPHVQKVIVSSLMFFIRPALLTAQSVYQPVAALDVSGGLEASCTCCRCARQQEAA